MLRFFIFLEKLIKSFNQIINIKIYFCTILFFIFFPYQAYSQDSLIDDNEDYRIFYVGKTVSTNQLASKFVAFTIFVNVPIDTSFYRWDYPNPFTPPNINQKFIYQLSNKTDIQINILNTQNSVLSNINLTERIKGYYYYIIKSDFFDKNFLYTTIQSSFENYRIKFVIKDEEYILPLRTRTNLK